MGSRMEIIRKVATVIHNGDKMFSAARGHGVSED